MNTIGSIRPRKTTFDTLVFSSARNPSAGARAPARTPITRMPIQSPGESRFRFSAVQSFRCSAKSVTAAMRLPTNRTLQKLIGLRPSIGFAAPISVSSVTTDFASAKIPSDAQTMTAAASIGRPVTGAMVMGETGFGFAPTSLELFTPARPFPHRPPSDQQAEAFRTSRWSSRRLHWSG